MRLCDFDRRVMHIIVSADRPLRPQEIIPLLGLPYTAVTLARVLRAQHRLRLWAQQHPPSPR
jgi:hypothetical protein